MARGASRFLLFGTLVLTCFWVDAASTMAANNAAAAKARVVEARRVAVYWQPDAALVSIGASGVDRFGRVPVDQPGWTYTFYAPATGRWMRLIVQPKGFEQREIPAGETAPLPPDFVDSDVAMAAALQNGFHRSGSTRLTLSWREGPKLKAGVYWCAASGTDVAAGPGAAGYCVDPATGRFVARVVGP
jgi:hypothetical protein